jgi:hypothetical protein
MKKWTLLLALLIVLQALSLGVYLGRTSQPGFPLDDAWIHQTYARNLGLHGMMAFSPGQPSTGSTSFGWTVLLAAGYFLNIPILFWTYLWGSLFAIAAALAAAFLADSYFGNERNAAIVAIVSMLEWHLAWSSVSGMEISLFTFISLLFLLLLHRNSPPYLIGVVAGLAFLVRPEALILIALYGAKIIIKHRADLVKLSTTAAIFIAVFLAMVGPWALFNLSYSGRPFPSTISSKFMQYGYPFSIGRSLSYIWNVVLYFWNGPLMVLVPCAGFAMYAAFRKRKSHVYYALTWSLSVILIYAITLPAIYHHGRYLMPLIPILAMFGIEGLTSLFAKYRLNPRWQNIVWLVIGGMLVVLWIDGASTFALQVRLLTDNHAEAAQWVNDHAPQDAVIATHDIGLIGYITQRQLVDLAGLVTPEVIPIMHDQARLAEFVRQRDVTYAIVFTGYYEDFLSRLNAQLVHSPPSPELGSFGLEPFEVFQIPDP